MVLSLVSCEFNVKLIVLGQKDGNTWVRLLSLPVEGSLQGWKGGKVGDKVRVELIYTNAPKGFIDFKIAGVELPEKRRGSQERGDRRNSGSQERQRRGSGSQGSRGRRASGSQERPRRKSQGSQDR